MRIIGIVCLSFIMFSSLAVATVQEKDKFTIKEEYRIKEYPLDSYIKTLNPAPEFRATRTNNWRGYTAIWEVKDKELLLTSFTNDAKRVKLIDLFPSGEQLPIKAKWYTGKVSVLIGEAIRKPYHHLKYRKAIIFDIKDGNVINREEVENYELIPY